MQTLDASLFRPGPGEITVAEIVKATIEYAATARAQFKIDPDRVLIFTVPYDPELRESWTKAELEIRRGGAHRIHFDWHKWEVWTVQRGELIGVPTEWRVYPADREAGVPAWVAESCRAAGHGDRAPGAHRLDAGQLRTLAAEALAMADYLETLDDTMPGGL